MADKQKKKNVNVVGGTGAGAVQVSKEVPKPRIKVKNAPKLPSDTTSKKEWLEFKVFRDDPWDVFKPNSEAAMRHLAQTPKTEAIPPEDEILLQTVAADLDRSLSVEEIVNYPAKSIDISDECLVELERMPSWLRSMMEVRYKVIHTHFKHATAKFLNSIANRIDVDFRDDYAVYEGPLSGDIAEQIDEMENEDIKQLAGEPEKLEVHEEFKAKGIGTTFRVAGIVAKWKRKKEDQVWQPQFVNRAAIKLRRGLTTRAPASDLAFAEEDDAVHEHEDVTDSEEDEGNSWKNLIREQEVKKEAEIEINQELHLRRIEEERVAEELRKEEKAKEAHTRAEIKIVKDAAAKEHQKIQEMKKTATPEEKKLLAEKEKLMEEETRKKLEEINRHLKEEKAKANKERIRKRQEERERRRKARGDKKDKEKKEKDKKKGKGRKKSSKYRFLNVSKKDRRQELLERGHFRRYSKLFSTGCGDSVDPPKRLEHHYRRDESFHAYAVTLVTSKYFKAFVMGVILINAVVLALETYEEFEQYYTLSEIFDEVFLAFYLTEAIVKIYAHPFRYWTSGFNVFDFMILVVSIAKTLVDWFNIADVSVLRVLLIVRALRVLRGISLSVQLQVLVTALVETIKTNILSIVILLVLLLYIAAIIAFYLFGDKEGLEGIWGSVAPGMLRMVSFVTLDGWFDLMTEFEKADYLIGGRVFNLVCIVLGNFMFSNIFIAIIIMNISEATDIFRERIRKEREEIIRRKKELVFRRQKLDMRQLLSRQKSSLTADFFQLASKFQKLLRHDDLVTMNDICTSPLWMDSCYQSMLRTEHTSNLLMNLHREMANNLLAQHRFHNESRMNINTIKRGRYNRFLKLKAKLALIKHEIWLMRNPHSTQLRIRYAKPEELEKEKPKNDNDLKSRKGSKSILKK